MDQTFDLRSMGFAEMQDGELEVIDGGSSGGLFRAIGGLIIDVGTGLFHGLADGWNAF